MTPCDSATRGMAKLSFRTLDASKPLPIYMAEEVQGHPSNSRAMREMPLGMEKEEENELHFRRAMHSGSVIPTPDAAEVTDVQLYDILYKKDYKCPKVLIAVDSSEDSDGPDYDLDTEDESWLKQESCCADLSIRKFEELLNYLERPNSEEPPTLDDAVFRFSRDIDQECVSAVYQYWQKKRVAQPFLRTPALKTDGAGGDPYVTFRSRADKIQTRRMRRLLERSEERMKQMHEKRQQTHGNDTAVDLADSDGGGRDGRDAANVDNSRVVFSPLDNGQLDANNKRRDRSLKDDELPLPRMKRQYRKRKQNLPVVSEPSIVVPKTCEEDEERIPPFVSENDSDSEDDGPFSFRRLEGCRYLAPSRRGLGKGVYDRSAGGKLEFGGHRIVIPRVRVCRGGRLAIERTSSDDPLGWHSTFIRRLGHNFFTRVDDFGEPVTPPVTPPSQRRSTSVVYYRRTLS